MSAVDQALGLLQAVPVEQWIFLTIAVSIFGCLLSCLPQLKWVLSWFVTFWVGYAAFVAYSNMSRFFWLVAVAREGRLAGLFGTIAAEVAKLSTDTK